MSVIVKSLLYLLGIALSIIGMMVMFLKGFELDVASWGWVITGLLIPWVSAIIFGFGIVVDHFFDN